MAQGGTSIQEMLAVIEHEQQRPFADRVDQHVKQRSPAGFRDAEGSSDGLGDQLGIGQGSELYEPHTGREHAGRSRRRRESETGFANPTAASQGQHAARPEQGDDRQDLTLAPDEARQGRG